ncbi:MAG: hypothetical protein M5R40_16745 [Anaerolineae bacterium]|nr:hypothetical protein [Anaerolineae bacterium]
MVPKIVTVEEMRAIEAATDAAGVSYDAMMDHAGRAVADLIIERLAGLEGASVVVLVGPGNNGGDGLVAGRLIAEETDAQVHFYLLSERGADDANFAKVKKAKLPLTLAADDKKGATLREWLADADVIVDALLGTGRAPAGQGRAGRRVDRGRGDNRRAARRARRGVPLRHPRRSRAPRGMASRPGSSRWIAPAAWIATPARSTRSRSRRTIPSRLRRSSWGRYGSPARPCWAGCTSPTSARPRPEGAARGRAGTG